MTHATMFWEIFYCAIIWPKQTRPITLAIAVAVHGGIGLFLGMMTFGLMMITANCVFIEPQTIRRWLRLETTAEDVSDEILSSDEPNPSKRSITQVTQTPAEHSEQEAKLYEREKQVRSASKRLRARKAKLKDRESKYRERVEKLKTREARIKEIVERRRATKAKKEPESDGT